LSLKQFLGRKKNSWLQINFHFLKNNPLKGLFTRESEFALGLPIFLNIKIIIICKRG
jgi:hypothetical protein